MRSLVLGVNGQDGSYLAEALLARGYSVVGIGRASASRYVGPSQNFQYVQFDLTNLSTFVDLLLDVRPDFAFHFAAIHGASGFVYEPLWRDVMMVNVLSLHALLEHARLHNPSMRIVYAGSALMYPKPLVGNVDETTPARATCLYGIGKIAARELMFQYRTRHGLRTTNLVLFNHESPRRSSQFLLPILTQAIIAARSNAGHRTSVATLDFWIDWSAAAELMDIAVEIAERSDEQEFVLASGTTWHCREVMSRIFSQYDLKLACHVVEKVADSDVGTPFQVRLDRLERAIGRRPRRSVADIVAEMVAFDSHGAGFARRKGELWSEYS
jgi:GDPmannose 4,6-dehydratase